MFNQNFEFQLLLYCCHPQKTTEIKEKIDFLLTQEINWEKVLNLANQHGITCLFYHEINQLNLLNIPSEVINFLKQKYLNNSYKNLKSAGELLRLIKLFESKNINIISFKGCLLAQLAYQNLALREFEDLDLLIEEDNLILFNSILKNEGYQPQFALNDAQLNIYLKLRSEFIYWHPQKDITLDIHWQLLPRYFSFSDHNDYVWKNSQKVAFNNHQVNTLSNELNLLFLCSHGSKHDWLYLCWIIDLAKFINTNPNLDWDYILAQRGNIATEKMLFLGLYLAYNLFDISLPEFIINLIENQPDIIKLADEIKVKLTQPPEQKEGYIVPKIYLQTITNLRDKIWFWIDTIMTPTALELQLIILPKFLFPIYYFIRFFRLIYKYSKS